MLLVEGDKEVNVNTMSNWPLIEDLFVKWGHNSIQKDSVISVTDVERITSELSAWGIPWKRNF